MKEAGFSEDVRKLGGIDIPTIQKHLNLWFSLSLDLHGSEVSSNAASYFANGLKGRAKEDTFDEHVVKDAVYKMEFFEDGKAVTKDIPMRNAMNEVLRDWYVGDCAAGVERWNRILERYGMSERLRLPDRKFNRGIGMYSGFHFDPNGVPISNENVGAPQVRVAAVAEGHRVPAQHHGGAGVRARQVRQLHRAAAPRRQPAADQFRVRQNGAIRTRIG